MDTQSTDILKHLLERLDKMDSQQQKLDRVIERLDTLQNILERQNQKQNLLDQMLVQMTVKLQKDTVVTTERIQGAQQEIIESFQVVDNQREPHLFPPETAQSLQSWDKIDDQLKSIEDRTVDAAQKCHQLTSWSRKMEDKMTELAGNSSEMMKMFLVEMRSVKDLIKGQTNSELIWLINQIDKKLSDFGSIVRDIYQQQSEAKEETARSTGQVVKSMVIIDKQMQAILDLDRKIERLNSSVFDVPREVQKSLDTILTTNKQTIKDLENTISNLIVRINDNNKEQSHLIIETLKSDLNKLFEVTQPELQTNGKTTITESEIQTNRIKGPAETAKEDLRHLIQTEGNNISKFVVQLGNIHRLINHLLESIQGNMTTVVTKIDSTGEMMSKTHTTVNKKLEEITSDLKDYICKTKREIFAVTEKEAQIVRDRIQGPLPSLGNYTFDFYVNNFATLVRSGKVVYSLPWHINELQTCMTGQVTMSTKGEMQVWILYGRNPHEVGLQPRSGKTLKIKVTICDIAEKKLPPIDVCKVIYFLDETGIVCNGDEGCQIGVQSCDMLLERGYGKQEGYDQKALLIRFEIVSIL